MVEDKRLPTDDRPNLYRASGASIPELLRLEKPQGRGQASQANLPSHA